LGLADLLRQAHRLEEAEAEYATLLGQDPKCIEGLVGAGQGAALRGDPQAATRLLNEALALAPKQPAALRELALLDLRHGRIALPRGRLKAAGEVAPYDAEVRSDYAKALRQAGDAVRAAEERAAAERLRKEKARIDDIQRRLVTTPDDADLRSE